MSERGGAHKTVLVTGGAGSVGREVSLLLAARGHRVRVFDLPGCDFSPLEDATEILAGDITDPDALRQTSYRAVRDVRFFAEEKGVSVLAGWRASGEEATAEIEAIRRFLAEGAAPGEDGGR